MSTIVIRGYSLKAQKEFDFLGFNYDGLEGCSLTHLYPPTFLYNKFKNLVTKPLKLRLTNEEEVKLPNGF